MNKVFVIIGVTIAWILLLFRVPKPMKSYPIPNRNKTYSGKIDIDFGPDPEELAPVFKMMLAEEESKWQRTTSTDR